MPGQELALVLVDLAAPGHDAPTKYRDLPEASLTTLREWAKPQSQQDPAAKDSHAPGRRNEAVAPIDFERVSVAFRAWCSCCNGIVHRAA